MQEPNERIDAPTTPEGAHFSTRLKGPDFLRIGVVLGGFAILLLSAAFTLAASPAPAASPSTGSQTTAGNNPNIVPPDVDRRLGGPGFRGGGRAFGGFGFGQITITAIDGNSLSLKTVDGWTRTISVTDSTTITRAGQKIARSDLKVGDTIRFGQTRQSDGTFVVNSIEVVLPRAAGSVTAVTADGFTLKSRDGTTWTITVNGSTTYTLGVKAGAKSDVSVGDEVFVEGTQGSGNALTAAAVHIQLPRVAGEVTAKSGNTLTIKRFDGTTVKVTVTSSTTYQVRGVTNATLSDVKVGNMIVAEGKRNADGSVEASSVFAGAAGPRKLPGRPFLPGPTASPSTSG
jgi:hypothetical protein